jgi:hypothetical protein
MQGPPHLAQVDPISIKNPTPLHMNSTENIIRKCVARSRSRFDIWIRFLQLTKVKRLAEVGVYKGDFASRILKKCDSIEKYYMIDPWRHLDNWNKPANQEDDVFEQFLLKTKSTTAFAAEKRIILRGKTTEVVEEIPDNELDFAYIDGDHTLRGIAIDLIRIFPKIRAGGWIGGDDFSRTVWQHNTAFEPTLVFPFAVYFAEAVGAPIYALPNNQFLIEKIKIPEFVFIDLTRCYDDISLRDQLRPGKFLQLKLAETFPIISKFSK